LAIVPFVKDAATPEIRTVPETSTPK